MLVIGRDGNSVGAWRERQTLCVRYRLPSHGPWAAGTRHAQRHPVNVPDDLAEAATLVREEELHLYFTLYGGEVWSGLHNGHLRWETGRKNGIDFDQGPLLLQELGRITL
jgi:hypothetical protein